MVLNIFELYLSLTSCKKSFKKVFDNIRFAIGISSHFVPKAIKKLFSGNINSSNISMKAKHNSHKDKPRHTNKHKHNGHGPNPIINHHKDTHNNNIHQHNNKTEQKQIKIFIVILANANPQPGTMMIHPLDAYSTIAAVVSTWGTVNVAGVA
jgi:hypothetical protein